MTTRSRTRQIGWRWTVAGGACAILIVAVAGARADTPPAGTIAAYHVLGATEHSGVMATRVTIAVVDPNADPALGAAEWELRVALKAGGELVVRVVSERVPMTTADDCGEVVRYVYQPPGERPIEYRDEATGLAVLPMFGFRENMLPVASADAPYVDGFAVSGRYLAQVLILDRVDRGPAVPELPDSKLLELRPDLLVGTSRSVRDDGTPPKEGENYRYVPFVGKDYDEMIDAGINYYGVTAEQVDFVRDRAVFWRGPARFPVDYYRSNFYGDAMYLDEPAVRLGWQGITPERLYHPQQVASFLTDRVTAMYADRDATRLLVRGLKDAHVDAGLIQPIGPVVPVWDTEYQTAFYQLAAGAPGIVHEGRYVEHGYGWSPNQLFGRGLHVTPEEMLLCYYAFMRGAARVFDGDWGMSIYGQSDPAMRLEAMTLAYDLGARWIWMWTSDHGHHVPYVEQLRLARELTDHADDVPRGDRIALREAARVAIVFPVGYTLSWGAMWGQRAFEHECVNRTGTAYREVVAAAMWEGVLCARQGVLFDFVVDHPNLRALGYERLLYVGENAGVTPVPADVPAEPAVYPAPKLAVEETLLAAPPPAADKALAVASPAFGRPIKVDGDLADWPANGWLEMTDKPSGGGAWEGPADLSARLAFAYDASALYVAARVQDDVQSQPFRGWHLWEGDCIQIGLNPLNESNNQCYTENQHEFGLALVAGRPIVWRWHGRRGQPLDEMAEATVAIRRDETAHTTIYEAAVPLASLAPLVPSIQSAIGFCVVINDNDGKGRDTFAELVPGAMTQGKHPAKYPLLRFEPPAPGARSPSAGTLAAVVWRDTVAAQGEPLTFDVLTTSGGDKLRLAITLESLEPRLALPVRAETTLSPGPIAKVRLPATVGPGRYRLHAVVSANGGATLCDERVTVFVCPAQSPLQDAPRSASAAHGALRAVAGATSRPVRHE